MGDPSGIGPEIAAKALADSAVYEMCRPVIFGDAGVMEQAADIAGVGLKIRRVREVSQAASVCGTADVFDLHNVDLDRLERGRVSAMSGKAAFEAIRKAIECAMDGRIDGTVTGPIHKEAVNLAGFNFAGHTEIYAHFTNTKDYAMMLVEGGLRIVHVSTHISLREACELVSRQRVLKVIELAEDACTKFGIERPRIGVAGLNPHASDGGLFGREEQEEIAPAIEAARSSGIRIEGPLPADTLFAKAKGGGFDVVIAMYHDQGHIPMKLLAFDWDEQENRWTSVRGVNITLGLPIVRTSVDHGTAFDQAGKGTASAESLILAIRCAARLAAGS
ncbi:MAG: 4-hydroxythreonine-4-phosphate dehydrogenase PdxA [Planctomycetota bacterium]|jgi:4-hydroxythreonine-4-phosphate dehydrogenase